MWMRLTPWATSASARAANREKSDAKSRWCTGIERRRSICIEKKTARATYKCDIVPSDDLPIRGSETGRLVACRLMVDGRWCHRLVRARWLLTFASMVVTRVLNGVLFEIGCYALCDGYVWCGIRMRYESFVNGIGLCSVIVVVCNVRWFIWGFGFRAFVLGAFMSNSFVIWTQFEFTFIIYESRLKMNINIENLIFWIVIKKFSVNVKFMFRVSCFYYTEMLNALIPNLFN